MAQPHAFLILLSPLLPSVTSKMAQREVRHCKYPSAGSCKQKCDIHENCKMSCPNLNKPCDQLCENGPCDMSCVTQDGCYQEQWCDIFAPQTCGTVRCTTTNCTQACDDGACNLTCLARSHCKQSCQDGSCKMRCPNGRHCDQVWLGYRFLLSLD